MIVTINEVRLNVDKVAQSGKGYTAHEVDYTNADGKKLTKIIFTNDPIASSLTSVSSGENAEITTQKDGKYFKWVGFTKTDKKPEKYKGSAGGFKKGGTYDTLGAKVGNISNCATSVYAAKLTESLKEAVDMVMDAHKYIEAKLSDTPKPAEVVQKAAKPVDAETFEVLEDDEVF